MLALDFVGGGVGEGTAILDAAVATARAGNEGEGVHQSRLAARPVAPEGHVPDCVRARKLHGPPPPARGGRPAPPAPCSCPPRRRSRGRSPGARPARLALPALLAATVTPGPLLPGGKPIRQAPADTPCVSGGPGPRASRDLYCIELAPIPTLQGGSGTFELNRIP